MDQSEQYRQQAMQYLASRQNTMSCSVGELLGAAIGQALTVKGPTPDSVTDQEQLLLLGEDE
jgi:hypothetical protein